MEVFYEIDGNTIFWGVNSLIALVLCALLAGIVIPQILLISFRKQLFDEPDERKIHQGAVPRLGGIAFKPVVFLVIALVVGVNYTIGNGQMLSCFGAEARPLAFSFCSIMILYLVGMADDLIGIRYRAKFVAQLVCGVMLIAGGLWIENLCGLLGLHHIPEWFGYPLTVVVVVFFINAVNLIDGLDGLASGLTAVAMLFYGVSFLLLHQWVYALLAFCVLGVLVPFFYYNVFGDPRRQKKIFMGDTGSLTIGIIAAVLSVKLLQCDTEEYGDLPNFFVLAFAPLAIPSFDVLRVYLHRIRHGNNPFIADKNHIHHKLLALGLHKNHVMPAIVTGSTIVVLCDIALSIWVEVTLLLFANLILWTVFNIRLSKKIAAVRQKNGGGTQ